METWLLVEQWALENEKYYLLGLAQEKIDEYEKSDLSIAYS